VLVTSKHSQGKGQGFPYSIPSVGPGADPGVQVDSPQVTVSHPPGGRLPLLSARPAVTFPAAEHRRPLAGTKLYCLVREAYRCEQLAQGCYIQCCPEQDLNLQPTNRKSNAIPVVPTCHLSPKQLLHVRRKTAAKLQFVHNLAALLVNIGPQPITNAMRQLD